MIKPSSAIRQNYGEVSRLCRETAEPVYLTGNGDGDLAVMSIEAFERREKMLQLREELIPLIFPALMRAEMFSAKNAQLMPAERR